jgi:DNA topoisomerase-3
MTKLWVAEKKSLAEAVANVLGRSQFDWEQRGLTHNTVGEHTFVWLDGHALEQAMPDHYLPADVPTTSSGRKVWRAADLPIVPQTWVLLPKDSKRARLAKLAELLKTCSEVYHLGDPDEEGQLLVDQALAFCGFRGRIPVRRVLVNDYNETKVRQAIANIRDNDEALFRGWHRWALARSRYDWLLGLNCTRAMTLRGRDVGYDGVLPVGSVQTPLLYIVRERDRVIESFKPVPYFTLQAHVRHANGTFVAKWKAKEEQAGLDESGRLVDAGIAAALAGRLTGKTALITGYNKVKREQKPPLPLSMNELQLEGFARYGYTGQQVLDAGQKLYETYKVTTYPRSDNRYLSEAQHGEAPAVIAAVLKVRNDLAPLSSAIDAKRKSAAFNDKKMEGTAHHGIVPTVPEIPVNVASWSEIERNVYDLIVRSYLAQFAAPYEYMQTDVEAEIEDERFAASGTTPVAPGWKAVFAEVEEKSEAQAAGDEETDGQQTLPLMSKGDSAQCIRCDAKSRKTTPPPRFDDKLLLEAMMNVHKYVTDEAARKRLKEGDGIGTTATRAGIIQGLKDDKLLVPVKPGGAKLMTSSAARTLIDCLPMDVKDPAQAGVFKAKLDRIARRELSDEVFVAETVAWIEQVVSRARTLPMKLPVAAGATVCPKCKGAQLRRKDGTNGAFWYCGNWNSDPKCDAKFLDSAGKPVLSVHECPTCKAGQLRRKASDTGAYWYCSNWNREPSKCEARFQDIEGKPLLTPIACPRCKAGNLRRKVGDRGAHWYCSNWNRDPGKCDARFDDKGGKPDTAPKPTYTCPTCKSGSLRSIPGPKGRFWGCGRFKEGCKTTFPDKAGRPDYSVRPR